MTSIARALQITTLSLLICGASQGWLQAQAISLDHFDVVPPAWITSGNHSDGNIAPPGDATAYIFPSLPPGAPDLPAGPQFQKDNFFSDRRHFKGTKTFPQVPSSWPDITLQVTRAGGRITIVIDGKSETAIRKLSWQQFEGLQGAFHHWLCHESSICIFGSCADAFTSDFEKNLREFWVGTVLATGTFADFSKDYINQSSKRNYPLLYVHADNTEARMHATLLSPGQAVNISWGENALYPQKGRGLSAGYDRPTVGGTTRLEIHAGSRGVSLFPETSWKSTPVAEPNDQGTADASYPPPPPAPTGCPPTPPPPPVPANANIVPFPERWRALMAEVTHPAGPPDTAPLIPIYGLLDMRDSRLLHSANAMAPAYIFLLSPENYSKADTNKLIAQFDSDGRQILASMTDLNTEEAALQLTRRFLLVGCDSPADTCAAKELTSLIDQAAGLSGRPCPGTLYPAYTVGVFANQTFVEVRNHVSLDGRPLSEPLLDGETWEAVIAGWNPSLLDRTSPPRSAPLLEVRRTLRGNSGVTERMTFLFHTTSTPVLASAQVFEGDAFHGKSEL